MSTVSLPLLSHVNTTVWSNNIPLSASTSPSCKLFADIKCIISSGSPDGVYLGWARHCHSGIEIALFLKLIYLWLWGGGWTRNKSLLYITRENNKDNTVSTLCRQVPRVEWAQAIVCNSVTYNRNHMKHSLLCCETKSGFIHVSYCHIGTGYHRSIHQTHPRSISNT